MNTMSVVIGLCTAGCGLLAILLAIPLVRGRVPRNALYGIRLRKSYESDRNWYVINHYGGQRLIVWGAVIFIAGIATCFIPLESNTAVLSATLVPLLLLIPVVEVIKFARSV